ncbi:hypothetical protein BN2476_140014 [Paraburkholderia piptadeniae]|uniref:Uncharacterized protein n=1 Tax=Paraburkholderia piptadeniae TaxID=1701573 RepID=A0A1N7RRP6_9BURK|nr:hypothetical protein BN2476_140014 [Paraburkholderia piptadeniae]
MQRNHPSAVRSPARKADRHGSEIRRNVFQRRDDRRLIRIREATPQTGLLRPLRSVVRTLGLTPTRAPEPADHHVLLGLIAASEGVALIPSSLKSIARGYCSRPREIHHRIRLGRRVCASSAGPAVA